MRGRGHIAGHLPPALQRRVRPRFLQVLRPAGFSVPVLSINVPVRSLGMSIRSVQVGLGVTRVTR